MTVNSMVSLSLQPPLVGVSLLKESRTARAVVSSRIFAVNLLGASQERMAWAFATEGGRRRIPADSRSVRGTPVGLGDLGFILCEVDAVVDVGDHSFVVGSVLETEARSGPALVYYEGAFRSLQTLQTSDEATDSQA